MNPYFHTLAELMAMGGHGQYVWASYGLTWLCILGLIWYTRSQRQQVYREINRQQARRHSKPRA